MAAEVNKGLPLASSEMNHFHVGKSHNVLPCYAVSRFSFSSCHHLSIGLLFDLLPFTEFITGETYCFFLARQCHVPCITYSVLLSIVM